MAERDKPLPGDEPTAEEIADAARLRDALDTPGSRLRPGFSDSADPLAEFAHALHAAWAPSDLDADDHRALVEAALAAADDAPPTEEELAAAEQLRASLEAGSASHADAELALSLRAAWSPGPLAEDAHHAIVDRAVAPKAVVVPLDARRAVTRRIYAGAASVVALAAGILLWLNTGDHTGEAPLAATRSTQSLFDEPFKPGEASARIDRIASARASDFRENRFAKWGVR